MPYPISRRPIGLVRGPNPLILSLSKDEPGYINSGTRVSAATYRPTGWSGCSWYISGRSSSRQAASRGMIFSIPRSL